MGRKPCCWKEGLKKGAWSSLEDKMLTNYVNTHGARDWRELPRKAGLDRCGKSCRLRWLNYLKPDIKRGYISEAEEDPIIKLHNLLGNRWSLIAGRLPGRTDNEIKNHWKTKLSKRHQENKNHSHQINQTVVRARAVRCTKAINIPHPLDHHHHHQENKNHDHQVDQPVDRTIAVRCTKIINIPHPLDHHYDQQNKNHDHQINQTVVRAKAVRCTKVINIPHPLDHHNQDQDQDQDKDHMVMVDQEDHQKSCGGENNKGDDQDHHDPVEESTVDCWIRSLKQHGDLHEDSHIGAMDFKALASFLNLDDDEWFQIN